MIVGWKRNNNNNLKNPNKPPNKNDYFEPRRRLMKFLLVALWHSPPSPAPWDLAQPGSAAGRSRRIFFLFLTKLQEEHQQH